MAGRKNKQTSPDGVAKTEVFVSYSRRDSEFVERLQVLLQNTNLEVWLDRDDIPPSANWRDEIADGIERSDALIIVVTPDSAASEEVGKEVDRAVELGKRIVPIHYRETDPGQAQPAVSDRNWVNWLTEDDATDALTAVGEALHIDPEWTKEHTRLSGLALVWDRRGRDNSRLLRGPDVQSAEGAIAIERPSEQPQATELMREFVTESRKGATRRQRRAVGISIAVAAISIALAAAAWVAKTEADRQRDNATSAALASQAVNRSEAEPDLSALLALEAFRTEDTLDARGSLLEVLGTPTRFAGRDTLHAAPVTAAVVSGDVGATGDASGAVIVWTVDPSAVDRGVPGASFSVAGQVQSLAVNRDGALVVATSEGNIERWDIAADPPQHVSTVAVGLELLTTLSVDGSKVAGYDGDDGGQAWVVVYDTTTGNELAAAPTYWSVDDAREADATVLAFNASATEVAWGIGADLYWWDWTEPSEAVAFELSGESLGYANDVFVGLSSVTFVGDASTLAFAIEEGNIFFIDLASSDPTETGPPVEAVPPPTSEAIAMTSFVVESQNGRTDLLASAHNNGEVKLWEVESFGAFEVGTLRGHDEETLTVAHTGSGGLMSGSFDGDVVWWRPFPATQLGSPMLAEGTGRSHEIDVAGVAFVNEDLVVSIDNDGTIAAWDPIAGVPVVASDLTDFQASSIDAAAGVVAIGGFDGSITIVDTPSASNMFLEGFDGAAVRGVVVSDDGRALVAVHETGRVAIWDLTNERFVAEVDQPVGFELGSITFPTSGVLWVGGDITSENGESYAVALQIDPTDGTVVAEAAHNSDDAGHSVTALAVSPDGSLLVTGGSDRRIFLWKTDDVSVEVGEWAAHREVVTGAAFVGNDVLVSGDEERRVIMWEVESGRPIGELFGPTDGVTSLVLHSEGRYLVAGSEDDTVWIWDLDLATWLERTCELAGRNMTPAEWVRFRLGGEPVRHCAAYEPDDRPVAVYPEP